MSRGTTKLPFGSLPEQEAFIMRAMSGERLDGRGPYALRGGFGFASHPFQFSFVAADNEILDLAAEPMEGLHGAPRWIRVAPDTLYTRLSLPNAADVYEFLRRLHHLADPSAGAFTDRARIRAAVMLTALLAHFDFEWSEP